MKGENKLKHQAAVFIVLLRKLVTLSVIWAMVGGLLCAKAHAQAPNFRWASQQPGDGGVDQAFGVATDHAGNVYVAGSFNFEELYVGPPSLTSADSAASPFLSKYDRFG